MTTEFHTAEELVAAAGTDLGAGPWFTVDQERIDLFADATGDHQWIHVDPERAAAGPFGTTIAHGYLTLSLVATLLGPLLAVPGATMGVNYGVNKVRFPSPVPVDSRVRARAELVQADPLGDGSVQTVTRVTVERDGSDKPACVVDMVARFYFG